MGFKVIDREFFRVRNEEISHKHFVSVVFPYHCQDILDAIAKFRDYRLYLTQLYSEAFQLHLMVGASEEQQMPRVLPCSSMPLP